MIPPQPPYWNTLKAVLLKTYTEDFSVIVKLTHTLEPDPKGYCTFHFDIVWNIKLEQCYRQSSLWPDNWLLRTEQISGSHSRRISLSVCAA